MPRSRRTILAAVAATVLLTAVAFASFTGVRVLIERSIAEHVLFGARMTVARVMHALRAATQAWQGSEEAELLREQVRKMESELALRNDVFEENSFLRLVADLPARRGHRAIVGGVFSYGLAGEQVRMVVNRGSSDGVVTGSAVSTSSGVLVGVVDRVTAHAGTVRVLEDPASQVTARVSGAQVSGLVRPDREGKLILDLVGKDERVREGMTVVSSGLDEVPAGLVIGTVRAVDAESTTLFQTVTLNPSYREQPVVRVLILVP